MELINYNYDLKKADEWQPITSFSASRNSFIILIKFMSLNEENTKAIQKTKMNNSYTFVNAFFKVYHVNNDINYNRIVNLKFDPTGNSDPLGKPAFFICLDINIKPDYQIHEKSFDPFILNPGDQFRVHLDYTDNCSSGPVNSGDFPCTTIFTM